MSKAGKLGQRVLVAAVTAGMTIAVGAFSAAPAHATGGFTDGGFEHGAAPGSYFARYYAPATVGAWTVTQGSVDLSGAGFWQHADGDQSLDLDGASLPGGIAQTFATVPLPRYRVTYSLAGIRRPGRPSRPARSSRTAVRVDSCLVVICLG